MEVQDPPAKPSRRTLSDCFEVARDRFKREITDPLIQKDYRRLPAIEKFLGGAKLEDLKQRCEDLSTEAGEKANNAAQLWTTLDQFKGAADAFLQFAPETISIVWFGISSLITIGNAKVQTRLLICDTCDSIANIIADCVRWESRIAQARTGDEAYDFDTWNSDVPDLIFRIFDFLWNAVPHMDQSRAKRLGSTLKDLFTKELQQKVDALLEAYQQIMESAKAHFEESVFRETLQTGMKIEQISQDIRQYLSIGSDVIDALQKHTLLTELDRQRDELRHSFTQASRLHFSTLNDRVKKITSDRGGRLAASWIFKEESYIDWKAADTNKTTLLCIRGPRGHGKSVAMMSVHEDVLKNNPAGGDVLICHFFFKRGEQDMQHSRTALESILYQLLNSNQLRKDIFALLEVIQIINPSFGGSDPALEAGNRSSDLVSLCDLVRLVAAAIPGRVYLMLDALDECLDRTEQTLAQHLLSLAAPTKNNNLRTIISARDSIDIEGELTQSRSSDERHNAHIAVIPEDVRFIEITAERNSLDLREYLTHDVGEVLKRQIDQHKYSSFFDSKLSNIVDIIHKKAKGDFTLARMIIANLKQPSKDSFEKRITQLPSAIGEIYMASLESLTPDEQGFVVTALRWTVWTVSSINVLEVSDHYREVFKETTLELRQGENSCQPSEDYIRSEAEEPIYEDPYERPEIKEIIYHIENSGRDFFRLNKITGIIGVDISIREWIQDDSTLGMKSAIKGSRGFNKYRDPHGNTVFNFVLTPSFVRYGDSLSELFNEREAHRTIAVNILQALNSQAFQEKYMPWTLRENNSETKRYEIDHWHDHIRILQKWWTRESLDDVWWSDLLAQLSIFMRPENWSLWNIQREWAGWDSHLAHRGQEYLVRLFDSPLHLACVLGLSMILDILARDSQSDFNTLQENGPEFGPQPQRSKNLEILFTERAKEFTSAVVERRTLSTEKTKAFFPQLDPKKLGNSLDLQERHQLETKNNQGNIYWYEEYQKDVMSRREWLRQNLDKSLSQGFNYSSGRIWDSHDPKGKVPLHLAAGNPEVVRQLIGYGANVNNQSLYGNPYLARKDRPLEDLPKSPLLAILNDAESTLDTEMERSRLQPLLESASLLVAEGANLEVKDSQNGESLLHIASKIRNLRFFKLLCVSGNWDVHMTDNGGRTPLHWLFIREGPRTPTQVEDCLIIGRVLIKMRASDRDLINMEDKSSKNALAYAVEFGFTEAVELLVELGADIHDLDSYGRNCFHHLAGARSKISDDRNSEAELAIASILFNHGLDVMKEDDEGFSPLLGAIHSRKWELSKYLLSKYEDIALREDNINLLLKQADFGLNLLHHATAIVEENIDQYVSFFKHLASVLGKYEDIKRMLLQRDDGLNNVVHYMAEGSCFEALEYVVNTNVPLGCRNSAGLTALDISAELIFNGLGWGGPQLDSDTIARNLEAPIKQFYYLLQKGSEAEFSFSFLGSTIFHTSEYGTGFSSEELFRCLDLSRLFSILTQDYPVRDMHGWSLYEALLINDFIEHASHIVKPLDVGADSYKRPTSLLPIRQVREGTWTSNGLLTPYNYRSSAGTTIFKSERPVPPFNATFYFEVEISSMEGNHELCLRIGLYEECNFKSCNITYGTDGKVKIFDPEDWPDNPHLRNFPGFPESCFPDTEPKCLGCGINPLERVLFFTVNGKIIEAIWKVPARRYVPAAEVGFQTQIQVNFGERDFMFKEANDPNWSWDWKTVELDWGGVRDFSWP